MTQYEHRHHLRIDRLTQDALEELCQHLLTTKSNLMRKYVQDGVRADINQCANDTRRVSSSMNILKKAGKNDQTT